MNQCSNPNCDFKSLDVMFRLFKPEAQCGRDVFLSLVLLLGGPSHLNWVFLMVVLVSALTSSKYSFSPEGCEGSRGIIWVGSVLFLVPIPFHFLSIWCRRTWTCSWDMQTLTRKVDGQTLPGLEDWHWPLPHVDGTKCSFPVLCCCLLLLVWGVQGLTLNGICFMTDQLTSLHY